MESGDPGRGELAAEVLAGRVASPVAAAATLHAATDVLVAIPTEFVVDPAVYASLQELAGEAETLIAAADKIRHDRSGAERYS